MKTDENIVILKADYGNATVLLNKVNYQKNLNEQLDENTYKKISKDPTEKTTKAVRESIKISSIPKEMQNTLLPRATRSRRLYEIPKTQKEGVALRPIISNIGS